MQEFKPGEPLHGWFGESWGAPINGINPQVPTPVDATCLFCHEPIAAHHQGYQMPYSHSDGRCYKVAAHKRCQHLSLGLEDK